MIMPTVPLYSIISAWRDAIANDSDIADYCDTEFDKPLTLYVGVPKKDPANASACPYAIIIPGIKDEGVDMDEGQYAISIGWGIWNNSDPVTTGNVVEHQGIAQVDELGQLILAAIDGASTNDNHPISHVHYDLEVTKFIPQFVGEAVIEISIIPTHAGSPGY